MYQNHRLGRCANIITGEDSSLPRVKPFKYTYEKEIVMYAYFKKLDYFSTECVYAPFAARGFAREFVKDLEVCLGAWCVWVACVVFGCVMCLVGGVLGLWCVGVCIVNVAVGRRKCNMLVHILSFV